MNAPCETALGDGEGEGENRTLIGDGEGTFADTPVSWSCLPTPSSVGSVHQIEQRVLVGLEVEHRASAGRRDDPVRAKVAPLYSRCQGGPLNTGHLPVSPVTERDSTRHLGGGY